MTDPLEKLITKTFLPIPETPYKEWPEDLRREARLAPEDSDLVLEVFNLGENGTLVLRNGICGHPGCLGGRPVRDPQQHARQHMTATMQRELERLQCPICDKTYVYMQSLKNHINAKHTDEHEYLCPVPHCSVASNNQVQAMLHGLQHTLAATSASPATITPEEEGMAAAQSFLDKTPDATSLSVPSRSMSRTPNLPSPLAISGAVAPQPSSLPLTAPTVKTSDKVAHGPGAYRIQPPFRLEPTTHLSHMPIPAISEPANQSKPPKANPPAIAPSNPANSAGELQRSVEDHLPANWLLEPEVRIRPGEPIDCGDDVLARHVDCLCTLEAENDEVCGKRCAHGHIQWVMHCFANHMTKGKREIMGWRCGFAGCTTKAKSRRDQVRNHYLNKHHPDKLYACQACGERFKSADDLRSHERKTHGGEDAAGSTSASVCASASKTPGVATRKRDRSASGAHAPEKLRKTSSTRRMPLNAGGTPVDSQPCVALARARPMSPLPGWTPLPEATEHPQQTRTADGSREFAQVQPRQVAPRRAAPAAARVSSSTTRWSPPPTMGWPTSYERSAFNRALSTTRESSVVSLNSCATPPPSTPLEGMSRRSSYHSLYAMQEAEATEFTANEALGVHGENEDLTDSEPVQDPAGRREADDDDLSTEDEDDDEEDQLLSSEGHEDMAEGEYASDVEFELKYLTVVQQSEEVSEPFDEDGPRSPELADDLD